MTGPRRKNAIRATLLAALVIVAAIGTLLVYDGISPPASWEGGNWDTTFVLPVYGLETASPTLVAHGGVLHAFVRYVSSQQGETGGDGPDDFFLMDIMHLTYDGKAWSTGQPLSMATDQTTEVVSSAVVFDGKLLVARYTSIRNVTNSSASGMDPANWQTGLELARFENDSFTPVATVVTPDQFAPRSEAPNLVLWRDQLYIFWRNDTTGQDYASTYVWRSFNGSTLSEPRTFELPTVRGYVTTFMPRDDGVWVAFIGRNNTAEPAKLGLGVFGGANVELRTVIADGLSAVPPYEFGVGSDLGSRFVFAWDHSGDVMSRTFNGTGLSPTARVVSGQVSQIVGVGGRGYCLSFVTAGLLLGSRTLQATGTDGNTWGAPYSFSRPLNVDHALPFGIEFRGRLLVFFGVQSHATYSFALRSYDRD